MGLLEVVIPDGVQAGQSFEFLLPPSVDRAEGVGGDGATGCNERQVASSSQEGVQRDAASGWIESGGLGSEKVEERQEIAGQGAGQLGHRIEMTQDSPELAARGREEERYGEDTTAGEELAAPARGREDGGEELAALAAQVSG